MTFGVLQQPFKEGGREGGKDGASGLPIWNLPKISSEQEKGDVRGNLSSSENRRILPLCVLFCFRNYVVSPRWVISAFQVRLLWRGAMCKVDGVPRVMMETARAAQTNAEALLPWASYSFLPAGRGQPAAAEQAGIWKES